MKLKYLFLDTHNGNMKSYHPFSSDRILTQEQVTDWLMAIPGATRTGTSLGNLLQILDDKNIWWEEFFCPCCDQLVREISWHSVASYKNWVGGDFVLLECVSGNY